MEYATTNEWNEALWREAAPLYEQAFPDPGKKTTAIIRRMFDKGLCVLHTLREDGRLIAIALTGMDKQEQALLIDYIAVREEARGQGRGKQLVECLRHWAEATGRKRLGPAGE